MSLIPIEQYLQQEYVDPNFTMVGYYSANQFSAAKRDDVEKDIKEYVNGVIDDKENQNPEYAKFCEILRRGDYMVLESNDCNTFWRQKTISDHREAVADKEVKRKAESSVPTRQSKRLREKNDILEKDALIKSQIISTSSKMKQHAHSLYKGKAFKDLHVEAQNAVTLGFNSTLDLSNHSSNQYTQKHIFNRQEWETLQDRYQSATHCNDIPKKVKKSLESIETKAETDLKEAYKMCLAKQAKYAFKTKEVYFKVLGHFIDILKRNPDHLEFKHKTFTEGNYVIKVWGPVLEYIFNDANLVVQWGESVNKRSSSSKKQNETSTEGQGKNIGDKIDFRICCKDHGKLVDLLNGEVGKDASSCQKYFHDHAKLARETKVVADHFYSSPSLKTKYKRALKVRGIQILAVQGEVIECRLVDNGLYVLDKILTLRLPTSELDLAKSTTLVKRLLELKRGCLSLARTYRLMKERERDMESNMDLMKNHPRSPYSEYDSDTSTTSVIKEYTDWVRGSWFPPSQYSKAIHDGTLPPFLLSPPPIQ